MDLHFAKDSARKRPLGISSKLPCIHSVMCMQAQQGSSYAPSPASQHHTYSRQQYEPRSIPNIIPPPIRTQPPPPEPYRLIPPPTQTQPNAAEAQYPSFSMQRPCEATPRGHDRSPHPWAHPRLQDSGPPQRLTHPQHADQPQPGESAQAGSIPQGPYRAEYSVSQTHTAHSLHPAGHSAEHQPQRSTMHESQDIVQRPYTDPDAQHAHSHQAHLPAAAPPASSSQQTELHPHATAHSPRSFVVPQTYEANSTAGASSSQPQQRAEATQRDAWQQHSFAESPHAPTSQQGYRCE